MNKIDLNSLGVKELTNTQLKELNGGSPSGPSWWDVIFWAVEKLIEATPYIIAENCARPQQANYQPYADLGHR
jgi:hypothetical protein